MIPRWSEMTSEQRRVLEYVRIGDGCWEWYRKSRNSEGYPTLTVMCDTTERARGYKTVTASRVTYAMFKGPIPPGKIMCHTCDNRLCLNPNHLYAGTDADNTRDKVLRGRCGSGGARGMASPHAKLTDDKVRAIRASNEMGITLAARYGVGEPTISNIRHRKTWRHVVQETA